VSVVKTISAYSSAKFDFIDIPLINWENLAGLRPTNAVYKTASSFCQHRTGDEKIAAGSALTASSISNKKLPGCIILPEMNQEETAEFAGNMN